MKMKKRDYLIVLLGLAFGVFPVGCTDGVEVVGGDVPAPEPLCFRVPKGEVLMGISSNSQQLVFQRQRKGERFPRITFRDAHTGKILLERDATIHAVMGDTAFLGFEREGIRQTQAIRFSGPVPKVVWQRPGALRLSGIPPRYTRGRGMIGGEYVDLQSGKTLATTHWPREVFSYDGRFSASAISIGRDGTPVMESVLLMGRIPPSCYKKTLRVTLWDPVANQQVWQREITLPYPHLGGVVSFDRDSQHLLINVRMRKPPPSPRYKGAILSESCTILLDRKTGNTRHTFEKTGGAWTADGRGLLLTSSHDRLTRWVSLASGKPIATFESVVTSPSGVLSGSQRREVPYNDPVKSEATIWNTRTQGQTGRIAFPGRMAGQCMALSENGDYLHAAVDVGKYWGVSLYDLKQGKEMIRLKGLPKAGDPRSYLVKIANDGTLAIQWGRTVRVYRWGNVEPVSPE